MKRFLALLLFVVALAGSAFAQTAAATKKLLIGVTMPTADHGWMGGANWWAKKAIADWQKKDPNVKFLFRTAGEVSKQAADIEDLVVQGVNGLVIFPFDSSITPVVEKAYAKGIYVVVLDRGITKPAYDVYLSNDDEAYARNSMEWICKELGYKGNIVLIEGIPSVISDLRTKTAKDVAAKYSGIKVLDSQPGMWNKEKALAVMENYLQKYSQISAVYTADDDMLEGALQAYKESGRKDIKIMFGGAAAKGMVKKIMDGTDPLVRADATYPPDVVATAVSLSVIGLRGRVFEGFYQKKMPIRIILNSELITKENAKSYYVPDAVF
jgi:ribose transport system substrate-binding protein